MRNCLYGLNIHLALDIVNFRNKNFPPISRSVTLSHKFEDLFISSTVT